MRDEMTDQILRLSCVGLVDVFQGGTAKESHVYHAIRRPWRIVRITELASPLRARIIFERYLEVRVVADQCLCVSRTISRPVWVNFSWPPTSPVRVLAASYALCLSS